MSTSNQLNSNFNDSEDEDDNFNPAPADISDDENGDDRDGSVSPAPKKTASRIENGHDDDDDDDGSTEESRVRSKGASKVKKSSEIVEEDDDEDDEEGDNGAAADDDDDEEDEDEEDEEITGHRRKRRRERHNQFIDVEAEVDEDEDENEDEEDENELKGTFIADTHPDDLLDLPPGGETDDRRHRELDRRREMEASLDAEKQAEILRKRYANRRTANGLADSAVVPKRLLLPSVDDPSIWAVRCKEGKEREAVFSITKRIEEKRGSKEELAVTSVFERGGVNAPMRGHIYVEALRQTDVLTALDGVMNVYPRTKMILMEIKEMPDLLRITKTEPLTPGAYVRLKRPPKYQGDLAQVIDAMDSGLEVRVRYVPRLDYGLNEDVNAPFDASGKRKRIAAGPRPPQRLFSDVEAKKRHAKYLSNPQPKVWIYQNEEYVNGFCEKDLKIQALNTKDVNPTLEEVTRFASGAEDGTENLDLNALAASLRDSTANASYLPGDDIEVYEGEQKGVFGKVVSVQGFIVSLAVTDGALVNQTIDVPVKGLRKRFSEGDHVKVIGGSRFRDEVGMVININEDKVTIVSDQSLTEITVFSKDLRKSSEAGGTGSLGQYDLWDLVQLDPSTVGCIVKLDRESMVVLDQGNETRSILPSQISNKLERRRLAVATDRNGSEIRMDDVVKEYGGESRQGKIMHIHRSYLFLHSDQQSENAGVFVARTTAVATISAKGGRINTPSDLTAMNPALKRNGANGQTNDMPPPKSFGRDRAIGQTVTIRRGPYKGLLGIVKDTTDTNARVELHTKNKVVNVPKEALGFKDRISGRDIDINSRGGSGGRGGLSSRGGRGGFGGATPGGWDGGSRTPMAASSTDRTPAWGARTPAAAANGGRTPAWKGGDTSGGRTPAWQDGSRTANPYDGSRTAYGSGNRTPAWAAGGKTPAYGGASGRNDGFGAGSRTPAYGTSGGASDAWGSRTPASSSAGAGAAAAKPSGAAAGGGGGGGWGSSDSSAYSSAPTPGAALSAPTPGAFNAPTPGTYNAPTPGTYNAPTPGPYSAPTPAASAPTPGATPGWGGAWNGGGSGGGGGAGGGGESAPTPAALGAPTPGASGAYYGAPTPGAYGGGVPETPGGPGDWGADDQPRYVDDD